MVFLNAFLASLPATSCNMRMGHWARVLTCGCMFALSDSFGYPQCIVKCRVSFKRMQRDDVDVQLQTLLAEAHMLIQKVDNELNAQRNDNLQLSRQDNISEISASLESSSNISNNQRLIPLDDTTGFLIEMQRKLDNPDFERIFDDRRVKGPRHH